MTTFTVTYGTIKDMPVELPDEFNGYMLLDAFAKAYVDYATKSGLISDDVLVSSIGASSCRAALMEGIREKFTGEVRDTFLDIAQEDGLWAQAVMVSRHGWQKGREIFFREYSGYPDELVEMILSNGYAAAVMSPLL